MKNSTTQNHNNVESLFLEYIRSYSGAYTDCNTINRWMQGDSELHGAQSIEEFKEVMKEDDYFEERHFTKVDRTFEHFKKNLCRWAANQHPDPTDIR